MKNSVLLLNNTYSETDFIQVLKKDLKNYLLSKLNILILIKKSNTLI